MTRSTPRTGTFRTVLIVSLIAAKCFAEVEFDDEEWDYEPRIWSFDEDANNRRVEEEGNNSINTGEKESDFVVGENDRRATSFLDEELNLGDADIFLEQDEIERGKHFVEQNQQDPLRRGARDGDFRAKSHFWAALPPSAQRAEQFVRHKSSGRLKKAAAECDQFRVDVGETVICDKKRCDKFDFEWPQHDNQLTLIQTTKHGMRFHRADFAFALPAEKTREFSLEEPRQGNTLSSTERVKFDFFELLKPKPTSTTTPSTTELSTTTTSTTAGSEESTATTATEDETTTDTPTLDSAIEAQDKNSTLLVTTFRLDTGRRMQKILGFGGALSDSTCRNVKSLSPQMAKSLMEDYFGKRGLHYNIARISIGSSDFSTTPYTNNDKEQPIDNRNDKTSSPSRLGASRSTIEQGDDVEMKNFRLVDEDYEYKIPVARQAIATSRQEIKFFSSLWSPPIWMKNNSHIVQGYLKGDVYGPYYKALAELIVKWLEAYRRQGIEFWATTGLNEPITGVKPFIFHNSLGIAREDYITFIKLYLGPMLRQRGFPNLKLIAMDDNKGYAPFFVKSLLDDKEASRYIAGIGTHWYMNDEYENLNFLTKEFPEKFVLSTEACNGFLPFQVHTLPGNWDRGVAYCYDIIKMLQKNAVGWVDWNMALDLGGGPSWAKNNLDSPVIVNAARDEYYKSPTFYAIGHFSKFVDRDSYRLDHRLAYAKYDYPFEVVGFYTPQNYVVIVAMNTNKHEVPFKIIVDRKLVRIVNLRAESFNTIVFKWKGRK